MPYHCLTIMSSAVYGDAVSINAQQCHAIPVLVTVSLAAAD